PIRLRASSASGREGVRNANRVRHANKAVLVAIRLPGSQGTTELVGYADSIGHADRAVPIAVTPTEPSDGGGGGPGRFELIKLQCIRARGSGYRTERCRIDRLSTRGASNRN